MPGRVLVGHRSGVVFVSQWAAASEVPSFQTGYSFVVAYSWYFRAPRMLVRHQERHV
jgi:hypothetical protein